MICPKCGFEYGEWELTCPQCHGMEEASSAIPAAESPTGDAPVAASSDDGRRCPTCGGTIEEWDFRCPHCGGVLEQVRSGLRAARAESLRERKKRFPWWILLLLLLAAIPLLLLLKRPELPELSALMPSRPAPAPSPTPSLSVPPAAGTTAVDIASPADGSRITGRVAHLMGTASGPGVTVVTLDVNGNSQQSPVGTGGMWTADVLVPLAENRVTASVTGTGGATASDRIALLNPAAVVPRLRAQLTWNANMQDVDLYVATPAGNSVYFEQMMDPTSGGVLDFDNTVGLGPENITFQRTPPAGDYAIGANWYENHGGSQPTATITVFVDERQAFNGSRALTTPANTWGPSDPPGSYYRAAVARVAPDGRITVAPVR